MTNTATVRAAYKGSDVFTCAEVSPDRYSTWGVTPDAVGVALGEMGGPTRTVTWTVSATDDAVVDVVRPIPYVAYIHLSAREIGPLRRVGGLVVVRNENGVPVPGATVEVTWTPPVGAPRHVSAVTGAAGITSLHLVGDPGTYTLTVTDIRSPGYEFKPGIGMTSRTQVVP